jgi:hypothetical protein
VTAHLVELAELPFYWPLDHQPSHAAEVHLDERLLAKQPRISGMLSSKNAAQ